MSCKAPWFSVLIHKPNEQRNAMYWKRWMHHNWCFVKWSNGLLSLTRCLFQAGVIPKHAKPETIEQLLIQVISLEAWLRVTRLPCKPDRRWPFKMEDEVILLSSCSLYFAHLVGLLKLVIFRFPGLFWPNRTLLKRIWSKNLCWHIPDSGYMIWKCRCLLSPN